MRRGCENFLKRQKGRSRLLAKGVGVALGIVQTHVPRCEGHGAPGLVGVSGWGRMMRDKLVK